MGLEDLVNKALSTDSDSEAEACLRMLRKKYKGKKVSPGSVSKPTRVDLKKYAKGITVDGYNIYQWKAAARNLAAENILLETKLRLRDKPKVVIKTKTVHHPLPWILVVLLIPWVFI